MVRERTPFGESFYTTLFGGRANVFFDQPLKDQLGECPSSKRGPTEMAMHRMEWRYTRCWESKQSKKIKGVFKIFSRHPDRLLFIPHLQTDDPINGLSISIFNSYMPCISCMVPFLPLCRPLSPFSLAGIFQLIIHHSPFNFLY